MRIRGRRSRARQRQLRRARQRHRREAAGREQHRRHRRRRLRVSFGVVGVALVLAGLAGALVVRDALAVERSLRRANADVDVVRDALVEGDVTTATASLARARGELTPAIARTQRPLWRAASRLPLLGDSLAMSSAVVDTVDAVLGIGRTLTGAAGDLIGEDGRLEVTTVGDRIDLAPARRVRDALAATDLDALRRQTEALAALPDRWVPGTLADARAETLALARRAVDEIGRARAIAQVLPSFLGDERPRRYFLAMQNPAELRGTGGLIGFYAVVTADGGTFRMTEPTSYEVLSPTRQPIDPVEALPVDEAFARRYGPANAAGFLANANVDPDVRTVAPLLLDLYERAEGERLDGVILVDPLGLRDLLRHIGPVRVPIGTPTGGLPDPLPADQIPRTVLVDAYDALGGNTPERETYLRELATAAFEQIFRGGWDAVPVTTSVARTALDGHVQLWSADESEQEAFETLGVAGALGGGAPGDWVAVTANNVAANKGDAFVGHHVAGDVRLGPGPGDTFTRVADLEVTVVNALPTSGHDLYVLGSSPMGRGFSDGPVGPRGLNRTWFTVWMPRSSVPAAVDAAAPGSTWVVDDRRAVDHVLETPSGARGSFTTTLTGPVGTTPVPAGRRYTWTFHRQPKAVPDRLAVRIVAPAGWTVRGASLAGGGTGDGLGPFGDPGPALGLERSRQSVVLHGDVTRTVTVTVDLAPA